jgi:4-hydroxybenzoate polyprenyltransferase/geranylgeranylglycerol-phosphate geranylgeranyltransferase
MAGSDLRTKVIAHLEMMRPYTMFHPGLVAIAGVELASGGQAPFGRIALAAVAVLAGWEAGLYASDYYDRELDAMSKPSRPVPSGRVPPREAFWTMVGLIAAGYILALLLGPANLALAVLTTVLGIAYSRAFKSMAILGNFDRGVLGVCAVLFGALAGGRLFTVPILLLCLLVFVHDGGTNLVGTMRDVSGDREAGYQTVPVVYGLTRSLELAMTAAGLWMLAAAVLLLITRAGTLAVLLVAGAAIIDLFVYLPLWPGRALITRTGALGAHKSLVLERLVLFSGIIAIRAPAALVAGLLTGTVIVTLVAQAFLRDRYEVEELRTVRAVKFPEGR